MKFQAVFIFITIAVLFFSTAPSGWVQEQAAVPEQKKEEAVQPVVLGTDIQWVWGEVVSADFQKNEILIKYLDYDNDAEKEMVVVVSEKTTYENIKSFLEIKPMDILSIDYNVDNQGKNIARNIGLEMPESEQVP